MMITYPQCRETHRSHQDYRSPGIKPIVAALGRKAIEPCHSDDDIERFQVGAAKTKSVATVDRYLALDQGYIATFRGGAAAYSNRLPQQVFPANTEPCPAPKAYPMRQSISW